MLCSTASPPLAIYVLILFTDHSFRGSSRMIYLYDTRNGITLLNSMQLDTSPATLFPFYDEGTGIVFLTGKVR